MSAPVLTQDLRTERAADAPSIDFRLILPPLALALAMMGLLFNREVAAAVHTWDDSTAYNHCYLVLPIALYLLWERRSDLTGIALRPLPSVLLLGVPLAAVWLVAERLGIMEGRQLVAISFVELLFLAVLGKRLWWAMAGPLLYLYFLVPFGDFLTPKLQDVTTLFVRHGLDLLGVPAFIDGYVIQIPQGTFFVAEACAGLRFLIASIAFGTLYALIMYRSPKRRAVFILVSMIVPVIANGFRALGIVYLGYILGSAQAAAADHIIYGWLFFSAVIIVLIALGLPFRQDEMSTRSGDPDVGSAAVVPSRALFAIALGVVVLAAFAPAVGTALTLASRQAIALPDRIDVGSDCAVQSMKPAESSIAREERALCGGVPMILQWAAFSPRSTAAPVMAERRKMIASVLTEGLQQNWLDTGTGSPSPWLVMKTSDPSYSVAASVWIDGKPVRPGIAMRLRMALSSLTGSAYLPMVVTVTPDLDWDSAGTRKITEAEESLPRFLLNHPGLLETVSDLSARR